MRPVGAPFQNGFVPMFHQVQQGQHPGGRHTGPVPVQHGQQLLMHQQMFPRAHAYHYRPGPVISGNVLPAPNVIGGMPSGIRSRPPLEMLKIVLTHASPADQRNLLGEWVYPRVLQLEPEAAPKITGMIVDLDKSLVLEVLESPEALKSMVADAMDVLRNAFPELYGDPADLLPDLSMADGV